MRKLLVLAVAVTMASLWSSPTRAEGGSELEISGNVTTVTGWQRPTRNIGSGAGGILRDGLVGATAANVDSFGFFVDQVELDLAKSFGENIRVRTDLDFSPHRAPAAGGVTLEQGYITANVPAGNGVELLVGRFNSGIGLDPIDRSELSTVSFSSAHRTLLPHSLTGARFGYDISEATRFELFVVNDLADNAPNAAGTTDIPSGGFNVIYSLGEEGNWVKFSGAAGPEVGGVKKQLSFLGDLSGQFAATDTLSLGAEGVFRQDDGRDVASENAQYVGGQLKATYAFSDIWDGTLRYGILWDPDTGKAGRAPAANAFTGGPGLATGGANATYGGVGLSAAGTMHSLSLATGYQIADGARLILEGSVDVNRPSAGGTGYTPGLAGAFAYSF